MVAFSAITLALSPVLALSARAGASGPGPNTWTTVGQGVNPATIPNVTVFGSTSSSTPEQVSFILQEQNKAQLEYQTEHGFNRYLTTSQFAQQYGQSQSNINALTSYLRGFGISTTVYPDDVDVSATGTAGEFDAALSVTQDNYRASRHPGGASAAPSFQNFHGPTTSPQLPYRLSQFVLAVLGLTNYSPFTSNAVARIGAPTGSITASSTTSPATCLAETGDTNDCNLPQDFASDYGMTQLDKHASGAGETLAIVTLAALDAGDPSQWAPQDFWQFAGIDRTGTLTVTNIDGGSGPASSASGSDETDIDVEQSGGVAPGANVIVYQAPNTDNGYADAFFQAASDNIASSVSSSWGESETYVSEAVASGEETSAYEAAFDEAFLELADQGQSAFVSAGDAGAYDASAAGDLGTTNLAVDTPGDSPYVTSSGGTTLPWSGTLTGPDGSASVAVTSQRAWGWDYLWPAIATITGTSYAGAATAYVVGGGGGFSTVEPRPSYQGRVSGTANYHGEQYLTPTDFESVLTGVNFVEPTSWNVTSTPPLVAGGGTGRAEPDLSADADPESGYLLYEPSAVAVGNPALQGGWGGTSFVAPQLNGSTAVIDSALGHRVGFWNPSIYAAANGFKSPFNPLNTASTSNDNLYYTGQPGERYNQGVGLGIPNLTALSADFNH